jgi:hypothetical protein
VLRAACAQAGFGSVFHQRSSAWDWGWIHGVITSSIDERADSVRVVASVRSDQLLKVFFPGRNRKSYKNIMYLIIIIY